MLIKKITPALAVLALLSACNQQGSPSGITQGGNINKGDIGAIAGAIGGGVIGSNVGKGKGAIAATIAGTLLGGAIGNQIGSSLDRADQAYHHQTAANALENGQRGQAFPWNNPQSGHSGTIIPSNYYQTQSGTYCREFTQRINIGGRIEEGSGTACRQPDGTWRIVQ